MSLSELIGDNMSKKLFSLIAFCLVGVFGCDDATVHEHIIDNFVCSYMPQWMGDCQSAPVTEKVESVLDHGFVQAQVSCGRDLKTTRPLLGNNVLCPNETSSGKRYGTSANSSQTCSPQPGLSKGLEFQATLFQDGSSLWSYTIAEQGQGSQRRVNYVPRHPGPVLPIDVSILPHDSSNPWSTHLVLDNGKVTYIGDECKDTEGLNPGAPYCSVTLSLGNDGNGNCEGFNLEAFQ